MYMLTSVMFCFCMRSVVDWSSSVLVGSGGRDATVWAVVLVKGMWCFTRVMRPPPPPRDLSRLSVVYPGNLGVWWYRVLSLVSWMTAACMLCLCRKFLSCCVLLLMPFMFICSIFKALVELIDVLCVVGLGVGVGGVLGGVELGEEVGELGGVLGGEGAGEGGGEGGGLGGGGGGEVGGGGGDGGGGGGGDGGGGGEGEEAGVGGVGEMGLGPFL